MDPLAGLTVVSIEQAVAAPFATRQLADLGARVIKIERPIGGDFARGYDETVHGQSSYFVWLNRGKESLGVDITTPEGGDIIERLLASADVFVQNLTPNAARRRRLDADSVMARHHQVIPCTITGYGSGGPWSARKAYDLLIQAEVGLIDITGTEAQGARAGISIADIAAGMYAYSGILTALLVRLNLGEVRAVEVSLFDALAEWMSQPANYAHYGGTPPPRVGAEHATIAPYGPYQTADGSIVIAVQNDREWKALCDRILKRPALERDERFANNSRRVAHRAELNAVIAAVISTIDTTRAATLLDEAGIAYAKVTAIGDLFDHPVLGERGRWHQYSVPGQTLRALRPPVDLSGVEPRMGSVPSIGEHTRSILAEHGMSSDDIHALASRGVVSVGNGRGG